MAESPHATAAATLAKLSRLHAALVDLEEKRQAIVDEMGELLAGGPGIGAVLKRLYRHFEQCWAVRYGPATYVFSFPKDAQAMKRLVKTLGVEEVERRMLIYCQDAEPFYVNARHSFALFEKSINAHVTDARRTGTPEEEKRRRKIEELRQMTGDRGCPHTPTCRTRQDCNRLVVNAGRLERGETLWTE